MQQHSSLVANSLPADPSPILGEGSKGQSFNFFRTWSCCISNKIESRMQQHDSKSFAHRPHPTLKPKGHNSTFPQHGHVAYQIKWNHECSKMVANVLPQPSSTQRGGIKRSKFYFFRTWSCCISN